ncbi:hypothetical protein LZ32DRAFT_426215 [Colletotrichum eremochloae]|nr:hypothetical protein LZ32DRAFT_426215 [Colletotrichum eremochloae]
MENAKKRSGLGRQNSSQDGQGSRQSSSPDQQQQKSRTLAQHVDSDRHPQPIPSQSRHSNNHHASDNESIVSSWNSIMGSANYGYGDPNDDYRSYGVQYCRQQHQDYASRLQGPLDQLDRLPAAFSYPRDLNRDFAEILSINPTRHSSRPKSSSSHRNPIRKGEVQNDQTQSLDESLVLPTLPKSNKRGSGSRRRSESFDSNPGPQPSLLTTGVVSSALSSSPGGTVSSQSDKMADAQTTGLQSIESNRSSATSDCSSTDSCSSEFELSAVGPKQALLHRLMDYFYSIISTCPTTRPCYTSHGSTAGEQRYETSHPRTRTRSSASGISRIAQGKKHARKENADDDDDSGERQRPLKVSKANNHPDGVNLRLACPFFKKNPGNHQRGACTGPGWATVHRVKEHIYRNHALPIICPRCNEEFANDRLKDSHLRASEQCEMQDQIPVAEGMDSTQEKLLRSRKRTDKNMMEVDKWNKMYMILFPDANPTCLPSPYYEYAGSGLTVDGSPETEFSRYEQFLRRELPSHVQRQLELRIEERLNPIEESLRSELVDIIRDTQIHLFNTYRSLRSSTPAASGGEPVQKTNADAGSTAHMNEASDQVDDDLQTFHQPSLMDDAGSVAHMNKVSNQVEDDLQSFYQPPLMDDAGSFDTFNGLLFDFAEMPPGSIDLDSGYWSVNPASKDEKELGSMSGEFGS